jgi:hypothetical protein
MNNLTHSDISFLLDTDFATLSVRFEDETQGVLVSRPLGYVLVDTSSMTTTLANETLLTHTGQLLLLVEDRIVLTTKPIVSVFVLEN